MRRNLLRALMGERDFTILNTLEDAAAGLRVTIFLWSAHREVFIAMCSLQRLLWLSRECGRCSDGEHRTRADACLVIYFCRRSSSCIAEEKLVCIFTPCWLAVLLSFLLVHLPLPFQRTIPCLLATSWELCPFRSMAFKKKK
eukprot:RCo019701